MIDTLRNQIMGGESQDLLVYFDYALKDGEGYPPTPTVGQNHGAQYLN